eukprot:m.79683 g.79683  ORF g.79683 m.79683 type:complete len:254 (-) comp14172_c0_seq1:60-821(-)
MNELNAFEQTARELFAQVGVDPTQQQHKLQRLLSLQRRLNEIAEQYDYRQRLYDRVKELKKQRDAVEDAARTTLTRVKSVEASLEEVVHLSKKKLTHIERAEQKHLDLDALIRYAHMISTSYSTSAPLKWNADDPRRPYPRTVELSSGILPSVACKLQLRRTVREEEISAAETEQTSFFHHTMEAAVETPGRGMTRAAEEEVVKAEMESNLASSEEGQARKKPKQEQAVAPKEEQEFYIPNEYLESDEEGSDF